MRACVRACVRARVRACVRACVCTLVCTHVPRAGDHVVALVKGKTVNKNQRKPKAGVINRKLKVKRMRVALSRSC